MRSRVICGSVGKTGRGTGVEWDGDVFGVVAAGGGVAVGGDRVAFNSGGALTGVIFS